jgi:hypothetical protein
MSIDNYQGGVMECLKHNYRFFCCGYSPLANRLMLPVNTLGAMFFTLLDFMRFTGEWRDERNKKYRYENKYWN